MCRIMPIFALLLLNACNIVVSREPWFTRAAEQGAPQLRPGVWNWTDDADCRIDETKPIDGWPDCASPVVVKDHRLIGRESGAENGEGPPWQTEEIDFILAAGDPLVLQLPGCFDGSAEPADDPVRKLYCYLAVEAAGTDDSGHVIRFKSWPVLCGPWSDDPEHAGKRVTRMPYPGLRMVDDNCEAESADALKAAAKSSEAETNENANKVGLPHWVRDGER